MAKRQKPASVRGLPEGFTAVKIAELGVQRGLGEMGDDDLASKIRDAVYAFHGQEVTKSMADNWSNYWHDNRDWTNPVLRKVAAYFQVTVDYLKGVRPSVPVVADISATAFPGRPQWQPADRVDEVPNLLWEGEQLENIYALRVKDQSLLPVLNQGAILYVQQRKARPEDFQDFDLVVYCDARFQAQVRIITKGPEVITLSSPHPAIKPLALPWNHAANCDLVVMTLRPQA